MAGSLQWGTPGTLTTVISTDLDSLATGTRSNAGAVFDNGAGLYLFGDFEANITFASSPTAGGLLTLFLLPAVDGTNYADGSSSVANINAQRGFWVVRGVNTAQRIVLPGVVLPPCKFKIMVANDASQNLASSGNTIKVLPYSEAYT